MTRQATLSRPEQPGTGTAAVCSSSPRGRRSFRNERRIKGNRRVFFRKRLRARRGVAVLDYVLVLGVILPLVAFVMWVAPRIMNLVYQMLSLFVSWPFM
jgi:hypothetical protein